MNTHGTCLICNRIDLIKAGKNPYFVKELKTGYIVVGDYQFYRGYTLFLCKQHVTELHELEENFRKQFLYEMSEVAKAVFKAFKPNKLNYELLGNTDSHLHWHIFPRYADDPMPTKPVWSFDKKIRCNKTTLAKPEEIKILRDLFLEQLNAG
jgi:diadenosine tetraphosphate (Ap4A) HIT family hydrolase